MLWLADAFGDGYNAGRVAPLVLCALGVLAGTKRIRDGRPGAGLIGFSLLAAAYVAVRIIWG